MQNTESAVIEVEADSYSEDYKAAVVSCPKCGLRHTLTGDAWAVNRDGIFSQHTWYAFSCECQQDVAFMLKFQVVQMKVGEQYLVVRPAHSFGVIEGELVNFKEDRMEIEILPKPSMIVAFDGETESVEPLPTNLSKDDWYRVRYVNETKRGVKPFWLNSKGCQILDSYKA